MRKYVQSTTENTKRNMVPYYKIRSFKDLKQFAGKICIPWNILKTVFRRIRSLASLLFFIVYACIQIPLLSTELSAFANILIICFFAYIVFVYLENKLFLESLIKSCPALLL